MSLIAVNSGYQILKFKLLSICIMQPIIIKLCIDISDHIPQTSTVSELICK